MKKSYILIIPVILLSVYFTNLPVAFCELDPELEAYSQQVIDHNKDYFMSLGFAVGPNKLTSETDLGVSYAASVEFGFFEQLGLYNSLHLGIEYSYIKNTYSTDKYDDDMIVPMRLLPKVGYGFILSQRVTIYTNGGIGMILATQKRNVKEQANVQAGSNESSHALGWAVNLALETNIKLHKSIALNVGFRADLLDLEPSEYYINEIPQVNGDSTTTISYSMNAGLKFSL